MGCYSYLHVLQKHTPPLQDYSEGNPINSCKTDKTDVLGIMELIVSAHAPINFKPKLMHSEQTQ
jgi:hypothetical protein